MLRLFFYILFVGIFFFNLAEAQERLFNPGSNTRENMLACPEGMIMTGINASTGQVLCRAGFDDILAGEQLDGPEDGGASQWPDQNGSGTGNVAFLRNAHNYQGPTMHWCGPDRVMTGVHLGRNTFLCSRLRDSQTGYKALRRIELTRGTQRQGVAACPTGMALVGLHAGQGLILCAAMGQCSQNAHCEGGLSCVADPTYADEPAERQFRTCRVPVTAQLFKRNGCNGELVTQLSANSGFGYALGSNGDEARSMRLRNRARGTVALAYDNTNGPRDVLQNGVVGFIELRDPDDWSWVLFRGAQTSPCLQTFEFPNRRLNDANFVGRYFERDNLDGKVSRMNFFGAILASDGRCLGPQFINEFTVVPMVLTDCANGGIMSWRRADDGTIRYNQRRTLELCLQAAARPLATRDVASGVSIPPFHLTAAACTGGAHQQWSYDAQNRLRIYSDLCLTLQSKQESNSQLILRACSEV